MPPGDLRLLFAVALVVMAAVGLGALIATGGAGLQPWLGAAVAGLGVGAGVWGITDWYRRR